MNILKCVLCDKGNLIQIRNAYECVLCGTQYTLEETNKLLLSKFDSDDDYITDIVKKKTDITGKVKTIDSNFTIKAGVLEKYNGESSNVFIPDTVRIIGKDSFAGLPIESVTIPESVTLIEHGAFSDCNSLTSVTIPKSVKENHGFVRCSGLSSVTFSEGSEVISGFSDCISLKTIIIPKSAKIITNDAFNKCGLESVAIPDGVVELRGFNYCYELTSLTIPESVVTLGGFSACKNIKSLVIPKSVKKIEGFAFSASGLESLIINYGVTLIGIHAFSHCNGLTCITIPGSVITIGSYAFMKCDHLASVSIPDSAAKLGRYIFYKCNSLMPSRIKTPISDSEAFIDLPRSGYCGFCAGKLKMRLLNWKCSRCGAAYPSKFNTRSFLDEPD